MPKGFKFGARSTRNLAKVHPDLIDLVRTAGELCEIDFYVDQGGRTQREQDTLYAQGRTHQQIAAAGISGIVAKPDKPVVTWTRSSKHLIKGPLMVGLAVDLVPFPVDFKNLWKYDAIRDAMWAALGIVNLQRKLEGKKPLVLRWGADWDMDGKHRERGESDNPHFEIVGGLQ